MNPAILHYLIPAIPYLVEAGKGAATEAGKQLVAPLLEKARQMWSYLKPHVESEPELQETVTKLATDNQNAQLREAFGQQLESLLSRQPQLAQELKAIVVQNAAVIQNQYGQKSIQIAGPNSGTMTIS